MNLEKIFKTKLEFDVGEVRNTSEIVWGELPNILNVTPIYQTFMVHTCSAKATFKGKKVDVFFVAEEKRIDLVEEDAPSRKYGEAIAKYFLAVPVNMKGFDLQEGKHFDFYGLGILATLELTYFHRTGEITWEARGKGALYDDYLKILHSKIINNSAHIDPSTRRFKKNIIEEKDIKLKDKMFVYGDWWHYQSEPELPDLGYGYIEELR